MESKKDRNQQTYKQTKTKLVAMENRLVVTGGQGRRIKKELETHNPITEAGNWHNSICN